VNGKINGADLLVRYSASNRIGQFRITYEMLEDRELMRALFSLCLVLKAWDHESGRGKEYICASDLFDEVAEGNEVPEYRLEFDHPTLPLADREAAARCVKVGDFGFRAVRKIIVRVPPLAVTQSFH
jgi:hypothetical protein